MYYCADCVSKPCRSHELDRLPLNCPTAEFSEEENLDRYTEEEREMAYCSARVEGDFYCQITRVEEIMEYALRMGYEHLGVAFCVGHDTLFIRHCNIPCTVLAVKDRVLAHNPVGALYMSEGYMKKRLYTYVDSRRK